MGTKSKDGCDTPACSSKDDMMRMMRAVVRERTTTSESELGENLASSSSSATETARDKKENDAARVQKATVGR